MVNSEKEKEKLSILKKQQEAKLFELVMNEIANDERHKGLWGKAIVVSNGDEKKAEAEYIKLRVEFLKDEKTISKLNKEIKEEEIRLAKKVKEEKIQNEIFTKKLEEEKIKKQIQEEEIRRRQKKADEERFIKQKEEEEKNKVQEKNKQKELLKQQEEDDKEFKIVFFTCLVLITITFGYFIIN